ncbi:MAG: hypothetical protein CM15mP60_1350 [Alphaproteobacteria bacterium]|nr:MAG: hypothetical protein CM15mP60_1350 [Alphaproteobacteria bacterium]
MKYVVTSVWKHLTALDRPLMSQNMSSHFSNPHIAGNPPVRNRRYDRGSVAIYHSERGYETNLAAQEENSAQIQLVNTVSRCSTKRSMVRAMSISQACKCPTSLHKRVTISVAAFSWCVRLWQ